MALDLSQLYLASRGHGRLYARGSDSNPQNKPADSAYNAEVGTIGINLTVAFVVDDVVSEGSAAVRFLESAARPSGPRSSRHRQRA
jgi:hypothetical protein